MKSPITGKEMRVKKEWREMRFRKENFWILFHSYLCEESGEQFEDDRFASLNYNQLLNQYREKYALPFPERIAAIRNQYNLSAKKMSEILGFGVNIYRNYEGGEVPNQSNARLIQLAEDPREFRKLVNLSNSLGQKLKEKITDRIDRLIEKHRQYKQQRQLEEYLMGPFNAGSLTGYKVPNLTRFTELVVYFAENLKPWKTGLNKLLFYADFSMYKHYGYSISGARYQAIEMGPVPARFSSIFEYLIGKGEIDIRYKSFTDGGIGEQFIPNPGRRSNTETFSDDEFEIMEKTMNRFKNAGTQEIIDISHREKAWKENHTDRKIIDYKYAFELND